jgi:hypothetical protein
MDGVSRNRARDVLMIALMFLWIFPLPLNIGGNLLHLKNPIVLILILYLLIGKQIKFRKDFLLFVSYLILLLAYSMAVFIFHGTGDTYGIQTIFWGVIFFIGSYAVVKLYMNEYGSTFGDKIIWHIILVGVAHAVIIFLLFIFEGLREILYSFIYLEDLWKNYSEANYRLSGIRSGGGTDLSVIHSFFFVIIILYIYYHRKVLANKQVVALAICAGIVFLSNIFISRTGLAVSAVVFLLFLLFTLFKVPSVYFRAAVPVSIIVVIVVSAFVVGIQYIPSDAFIQLEETIIPRALALVTNYIESGRLYTDTTDVLMTMFFLPDDVLMGIGAFGRDEEVRYIASDVGYVRLIFGFGLVGTIAFYFFYVLSAIYAVFNRNKNPMLSSAIMVISLMILVVNIKEMHAFAHVGSSHILFLLLSSLIMHNNRER